MFADNSDAAFANYRMWESVGFLLGYSYSSFLCMNIKMVIILISLFIGMVGYVGVEIRVRRREALDKELNTNQDDLRGQATAANTSDSNLGFDLLEDISYA